MCLSFVAGVFFSRLFGYTMKVQTRQKDRAVDNRGAIDWTIRALDTRMSHIGLKTFLF